MKDYTKQLEEENATLRYMLEGAAQWIPQWVYPYDLQPPKHADGIPKYREEYFLKQGIKLDKSDVFMRAVVIPIAEYKIKKFVIGQIMIGHSIAGVCFSWDRVDRRGAIETTIRFKHAKDKIESYWRSVSGE